MPSIDNIYRNPGRWRAVIHTQDIRHGTAGCLLSVVLFAPLFVRQMGMTTVACFVLVYGLIIVPAVTKFFSPVKVVLKLGRVLSKRLLYLSQLGRNISVHEVMNRFSSSVSSLFEGIGSYLWLLLRFLTIPFVCIGCCFLPCLHGLYLAFEGFRITSNQIVFFTLCEKLLTPEFRLSSLHYLLFYSVLAYVHRALVTRQWSQSLYESNMREFLQLTTWFIAVRLAKGVAMSFVLVIFTIQFRNAEPNVHFVAITFLYFVLTQKKWTGNEKIVSWVRHLEIDWFEEEEEFWLPFFLNTIPIAMSISATAFATSLNSILCIVSIYTNLLVPYLILKNELETHFVSQDIYIRNFRKSTPEEIQEDPICPVCLEPMRIARVTPCKHLYHAMCLRKCVVISTLCPLCKQELYSLNEQKI